MDCNGYHDIIMGFLATIAGAFVGAWAAFRFESYQRAREVIEQNLAAANRALYTIFNLWNILSNYREQLVNPFRDRSDAWINMPVTYPAPHGLATFQANELGFLLETEHANVYSDLLLEEQNFAFAVNLIEQRSSTVHEKVYPRLAAAGVSVGSEANENELERAIGNDVVHKLKCLTNGIITNVDSTVESLEKTYGVFREVIKKLYPGRKLIAIEFKKSKVNG